MLLLLDGELGPQEEGELLVHLQRCWGCRARMEKLQKGLSVYGEYGQAVEPAAGAPPKGWTGFRAMLDRISIADYQERSEAS